MKVIFLSTVLFFISWSFCLPADADDSDETFQGLHHAKASFDLTAGPTEPQTEGSFVPGGQGGFFLTYRGSDEILKSFNLIGSRFNLSLLGGRPTVRFRLDWDLPGFLLKSVNSSSYFYYTPIVIRGLLTNHVADNNPGPDGSNFGNSYGLGSTRVGLRGESEVGNVLFSGGFEVGPEGGYIKDRGGHAAFAGFVAATQVRMFSDSIFFGLGAEGHFNVLRAFDLDSLAQHAFSGNAELGIPFSSLSGASSVLFSIGLRTQVDYFDVNVKNNSMLSSPNGLSLYGGFFLRWEGGDLH